MQRLVGKWEHVGYGLIEAPDCVLCYLAQSTGIKSYGECISIMAGEPLQGHRPGC